MTTTAPLTTAPVVVDRKEFLGGSDAAAVMGLSPWATPVELWQFKTGRKPKAPPDPAHVKRWERGHKLEPFIRDMAIEKLEAMGLTVELLKVNERYNDPEHPFLACEIDFELRLSGEIVIGETAHRFDGEHVNADAKSVSGFARKKWGDVDTEDVPIEYAAQFMHGLMVTGRRFCLVAALRSFDDVDIYWTVRDDDTIAGMRPKLVSFWVDHVLADVPPDPLVFSDIKALFPIDNGEATEATQEIADKVARLRWVKSEIKALEDEEEVLTFDVGNFISPAARLTYEGKDIATWKGQNDSRIDQTALKKGHPDIAALYTNSKIIRVLRLTKPKT
jgi:putative phage-type endonuclease